LEHSGAYFTGNRCARSSFRGRFAPFACLASSFRPGSACLGLARVRA
jgi:hypothetical protein